MKEWITIFLAWWVVPITMIAFWLRYIPRHDWFGTFLHIGLIVLSIACAIVFYRMCALILQGKEKTVFQLQSFWSDRRFHYGVSVVVIGFLFSIISYNAINGSRPSLSKVISIAVEKKSYFPDNMNELVPWAFYKIGYNVFADLRDKAISEKPANYWVIKKEARIESVKGANVGGRNLNYANTHYAFLVKADLRGASLKGAIMWEANLQQADLREAKLQQASLFPTKLQQANLSSANLQHTEFYFANLHLANLNGTNLQQANLSFADLSGAKNLTIEQLSKVKTLYKAKLDPEIMEQLKKCCPYLLEEPKEETEKTE